MKKVELSQAEIKATKSLKELEALLRNKLNSLRERTDKHTVLGENNEEFKRM